MPPPSEPKSIDPSPATSASPRPQPVALARRDREDPNAYEEGGLHPVYVGDVYNDRYRVLNKLGHGGYSTVWLVKDLTADKGSTTEFQALKILRADAYDPKHPIFEREIMAKLRAGKQSYAGYKHICHMLDTFEHKGPNGTHVCLLLELMGENLRSFADIFAESEIPPPVMRHFTYQLLCALDYAHYYNIIHTDIQPLNIYVKVRDYSDIESGYLMECPPPVQDRSEAKYTPIPSRSLAGYYYPQTGKIKSRDFDVTLGDWGVSSWADNHLTTLIQPQALRAPEVLIGAPWDATTDVWNLGAVVYEMLHATPLFKLRLGPNLLEKHLAQIVELFGPFPKTLLEKGDATKVAANFDEKGMVKGAEPPQSTEFCPEAWFPQLSDDEREVSASFLLTMMTIDPAERPLPEVLVKHPWLRFVPVSGEEGKKL